MRKTICTFIVCCIFVLSLTACGMTNDRELQLIKEVSGQCDHIASLAFDGTNTATTKSKYDIDRNTYTLYVINTNVSSEDMENFKWQGNGSVVLNLENSINSLCLSMKTTFDSSELKSENYDVIVHFTDKNENIYFSSTNGVTSFSKWGR
ncbi:MAG: hypothetical protein ACI4XH_09330 [Acutalibacteraceae bacterium]